MRNPFTVLLSHVAPSAHNSYRPHFLRSSWLGFFIALILAAEGFLVTNLAVRQSSENFIAAVVPGEIITLTNIQRTDNKISSVRENSYLDKAAQAKAHDMATKGYFSHTSPDGKQPWTWIDTAGYTYSYAGENLAVRFIDSRDVVNAWMGSETHKANILKPAYSDIGVGVAEGSYQGAPATYVVQYFGAPVDSQSAAIDTGNQQLTPIPRHLIQILSRIEAEPIVVTEWLLGFLILGLTIVLCIAFFVHIQIQSMRMLTTGATVVVLAVLLLISDATILRGGWQTASQSANVYTGVSATDKGGVVISAAGAEIQR